MEGRESCVWLSFGKIFSGLWIPSLLFADDVVLLISSCHYLQLSLEWFAAQCEAAEMKISTSKSELMVTVGIGWTALSRLGLRFWSKWWSSSILGFCSGVREELSLGLTDESVQLP